MLLRFLLAQPGTLAALTLLALVCSCADPSPSADDEDAGSYVPPPFMPPVCFAAGTLIDTPDGPRAIEQLAEGHFVWSYDHSSERVVLGRVAATMTRRAAAYGTLPVPGPAGSVLRLTPEHPIFVRDRYVKAKCVHAGNELRVLSDAGVQRVPAVASYTSIPDAGLKVYNLTVNPHENYFAGGLLVHNKSQCWQTGPCTSCGCPSSCTPNPPLNCRPYDAGSPFDPRATQGVWDAGGADPADECKPEAHEAVQRDR